MAHRNGPHTMNKQGITATIRIYSKSKQTKGKDADKVTTIAERTIDTLTYTVTTKGVRNQLAQLEYFVGHAIGARYKAFVQAGKRMPSIVYSEVTLDGRVFRSESALLQANMQTLVAVRFAGLKDKSGQEIIEEVAAIQAKGVGTAVQYLNDVRAIAAAAERIKVTGKGPVLYSSLMSADLLDSEPVEEVGQGDFSDTVS